MHVSFWGPAEDRSSGDALPGATKDDGTLVNAAALVREGLLAPYATLTLVAHDIDYECEQGNPPVRACERDRVSFNGVSVKVLEASNAEYLRGANNVWDPDNTFRIPIEKVKFPSGRGTDGNSPTPAINEIRIDIDTANVGVCECWCTSIDWVALEIKCMSPIILIHGNGQNGAFFNKTGRFGRGLTFLGLPWAAVDMAQTSNPPGCAPRQSNAKELDTLLPTMVRSFGADSVHLVAHSKGGLDAREYLAVHQPAHESEFSVLTLTTLSTPHNGSALADTQILYSNYKTNAQVTFGWDFPLYAQDIADMVPAGPGTEDLQTTACTVFNARNVRALTKTGGTAYGVVAADADYSGNGEIDWTPDDEYREMREDNAALAARFAAYPTTTTWGVDIMYEILRDASAITVELSDDDEGYCLKYIQGGPFLNDCLVTIPSALGEGHFASLVGDGRTRVLTGPQARNHSSVTAASVGDMVIEPWLRATEATDGDLK